MKPAQALSDCVLDRAYEINSDDAASFNDANVYFFETDSQRGVSDLPHVEGLTSDISNHIHQVSHLMQSGLSLHHHAQILLGLNGAVLAMNAIARQLIGEPVRPYIDSLNISRDTLKTLRGVLKTHRQSKGQFSRAGEQIIHMNLLDQDSAPRSLFGFCMKVGEGQRKALLISLSAFRWTQDVIDGLAQALSLTSSESEILAEILSGKNQKDIAKSRARSPQTIKAQTRSILRKANCGRVTDLTSLCISTSYIIGLHKTRQQQAYFG